MKLAVVSSPFELGAGRGDASGCIAGILHWILCRNLRCRSCTDEGGDGCEEVHEKPVIPEASRPGIVARLMGLDFMPAPPEKISRSRSANSAEPWHEPAYFVNGGSLLRKSRSFREVPSYLIKENDDFLVLSFDNEKEYRRERRKMAEKKMPKLNEAAERSTNCRKKLSISEGEIEMEWGSLNSSPVSVLDLLLEAEGDCLTSPDGTTSTTTTTTTTPDSSFSACKFSSVERGGEEEEEEEEEYSRKKLLAKEGGRKSSGNLLSFALGLICRICEDDLKSSKWITGEMVRSEEAQAVGHALGLDILELLLNEVLFEMLN